MSTLPKPNDMKAVAKARIFIAAGLEFEEAWIPRFKASAKNLVVVKSDAKIAKLKEERGEQAEHDEKHEAHADPHVWLNPMLAITMARNISDALIDMDKANKDLLDSLFEQAKENPRLRQNMDLRTSSADTSQRMLNALLPGTVGICQKR